MAWSAVLITKNEAERWIAIERSLYVVIPPKFGSVVLAISVARLPDLAAAGLSSTLCLALRPVTEP